MDATAVITNAANRAAQVRRDYFEYVSKPITTTTAFRYPHDDNQIACRNRISHKSSPQSTLPAHHDRAEGEEREESGRRQRSRALIRGTPTARVPRRS